MVERDLKALVSRKAETVCYSNLKMAMQTPSSESLVWVIVEGVDDEIFYEKMLVEGKVIIRTAEFLKDDPQQRGRIYVNKIVSKLRSEENVQNIIGIVDKDYWPYCSTHDTLDDNVFVTDFRDLEMTLVADSDVTTAFSHKCPQFSTRLTDCLDIATYMGYVRIAALSLSGNAYLKKWSLSDVWNIRTSTRQPDWQYALLRKMNAKLSRKSLLSISADDVSQTVASNLYYS